MSNLNDVTVYMNEMLIAALKTAKEKFDVEFAAALIFMPAYEHPTHIMCATNMEPADMAGLVCAHHELMHDSLTGYTLRETVQ